MDNNGKDTNNTRHIYMIVHLMRNGIKYKQQKIDWYEVFMQLVEIETRNVVENYLNLIMKYIMVGLDK